MELRVQLKICEGCGCLWFRAQTQGTVYCRQCETKLREFPAPETPEAAWTTRPQTIDEDLGGRRVSRRC